MRGRGTQRGRDKSRVELGTTSKLCGNRFTYSITNILWVAHVGSLNVDKDGKMEFFGFVGLSLHVNDKDQA